MNISAVDNADGTGVTVTVAGSAGGTVSLYGSLWSGGFVNQAFALVGSRVGNGTVVVAGTGYRWLYAIEGATATAMIGYRATDGDDPIFNQILDAVTATIQTLSLEGLVSSDVRKQKLPYNLSETLEVGVYVSPTPDTFSPLSNMKDKIGYGVQVTTWQAKDASLTEDLQRHLMWREQIAKCFRHSETGLAGVPEVYDIKLEPGPVIFPEQFMNNFDVGTLVLRCNSEEFRGVA